MKLIKPSHEIWEQDVSGKPIRGIVTSPETIRESLLQGIYKQIERAGRVCYKSEDKITGDSAEAFVQRMIDSQHYAMLEHGTVYLAIPITTGHAGFSEIRYMNNKYSVVNKSKGLCMKDELNDECDCWCITTNYRVIVENGWQDDLEDYLCLPTEFHAKRVTVHLTCNRQVTHELVRHRVMSFAQESTRYCNYTKGKFGGELTFIQPNWLTEEPVLIEDPVYAEANAHFQWALEAIEHAYFDLIKANWKPQQAATILPNALKAEIVVTGFMDDWKHLFSLRVKGTTGAPHPQMLEVMKPVYDEFVKRYGIA